MRPCPRRGQPLSWFQCYMKVNGCPKCREAERKRREAEARREWKLRKVDAEREQQWRPESCPFCGESMLAGGVW